MQRIHILVQLQEHDGTTAFPQQYEEPLGLLCASPGVDIFILVGNIDGWGQEEVGTGRISEPQVPAGGD